MTPDLGRIGVRPRGLPRHHFINLSRMNGDQFNPITLVVSQLNRRLAEIPFRPFDIVMSNGARHAVPTPDHITITRLLRRIQVETDALHIAEINPLHVASIEDHRDAA